MEHVHNIFFLMEKILNLLERSFLPRAEKLSAGGYSEKSKTEVITRKPVVRLWKAREQTKTRRQIGV